MEGSFHKLPNEMLEKIFSSLPLQWVKVARLVCRRWFRVLNQEEFILNAILSDETISNVKYFTKPNLASLSVKKFNQDILKMYGPTTSPPSISKLIIRDEIQTLCLINLLQYYSCSYINEMSFSSFSLALIGPKSIPEAVSSLTKWDCLKILRLWAVRPYRYELSNEKYMRHTQAIAKVLEMMTFTILEELSLNLDSGQELRYTSEEYFPLQNIYTQLATFLQRHEVYDKLKVLELKCLGLSYLDPSRYPQDLWRIGSIAQLDSIRLELHEFNLNYMIRFLNTQKQVKHITIKSFHPQVIDKLLATNSKSLESISIYGKHNRLLLPSSYASLKSLTVGFYNMDNFEQFLSRIQQPSFKTSESFPLLVTFNLVDTHLFTEAFQPALRYNYNDNMHLMNEDPIEDVPNLLKWILNCFPNLQQVVFIIRGDTKNASQVNDAANCILEKLKGLNAMQIDSNKLIKSRIQIHLSNCNYKIAKGRKASSNQYYEKSVSITSPHYQ